MTINNLYQQKAMTERMRFTTIHANGGQQTQDTDVVFEHSLSILLNEQLASIGMRYVRVVEPVKVALIATGSEIVTPGNPLTRGKIYNSISFMLAGNIQKAGMQVVWMETCADDGKC